jgi:hypothetical protein
MPSTHHKYSPSKLKNLAICPGYLGSDTTSEAAEEGTMLHLACETGNIRDLTDEQKQLVTMCRGYATELEKSASVVLTEERLEILGGALFGTADIVVRTNETEAHVIDYKFGRISVEAAETNKQGKAYALGVFDLWPDVQWVTVHFLQPRRDEISTHTFNRSKDVEVLRREITTIILAVEQYAETPEKYNPQHGNCLWCGRKAECPRVAELTAALVAKTHNSLELPAQLMPSLMSNEQLATALDISSILKDHVFKWVDMCKAEALQRTHDGIQIGDYVIERRSGKRKIVDALMAGEILAQHFGFTKQDMAEVVSIGITDVEKLVASKAEKRKGAQAKEKLNELLESAGLIVSGEAYEYLKKLN